MDDHEWKIGGARLIRLTQQRQRCRAINATDSIESRIRRLQLRCAIEADRGRKVHSSYDDDNGRRSIYRTSQLRQAKNNDRTGQHGTNSKEQF